MKADTRLASTIVPIDKSAKSKPHPEGFLHAAKRLSIPPRNCLIFEDTRPGIEAGVNAGMQVVALLTTAPAHKLKQNWLVKDFRDVVVQPNEERIAIELKTVTSAV